MSNLNEIARANVGNVFGTNPRFTSFLGWFHRMPAGVSFAVNGLWPIAHVMDDGRVCLKDGNTWAHMRNRVGIPVRPFTYDYLPMPMTNLELLEELLNTHKRNSGESFKTFLTSSHVYVASLWAEYKLQG